MRSAVLATIFAIVATIIVAAPIPAGETSITTEIQTHPSFPDSTDPHHPVLVRRSEITDARATSQEYESIRDQHDIRGEHADAQWANHVHLGYKHHADMLERQQKLSGYKKGTAEYLNAEQDVNDSKFLRNHHRTKATELFPNRQF
ncbi:hypothetical protein FRC16_008723 [Serendipita sp. 398]|nr:hypothetical protein FRC16_008723 [Serendipita sp. 398]